MRSLLTMFANAVGLILYGWLMVSISVVLLLGLLMLILASIVRDAWVELRSWWRRFRS